MSSELAQQTDLGHDALLCYHNDPTQESLDVSIQHFERAQKICPPDHPCRFAVMRNLAMAYLLDYQINSTYGNLDKTISLHREALDWCSFGHSDRPATLVYLAQALVYRYDKQGCDESVGSEIKKLVAEVRNVCSVDSHEYRAAGLVLQTCTRCRVENNINSADLDELISELDLAAQAPPSDSFDRPQRLYNLGIILLKQYELRGDISDLDKSIAIHEEAIGLTPVGHPDRTGIITSLCVSLAKRFERARNLPDLKAALQWVPQVNVDRARILNNLGISSLKRFQLSGDLADLDESIVILEEATQSAPESHPGRPGMLVDLGVTLLKRFERMGNLADLERSIIIHKEAAQHAIGGEVAFSFESAHEMYRELKQIIDES